MGTPICHPCTMHKSSDEDARADDMQKRSPKKPTKIQKFGDYLSRTFQLKKKSRKHGDADHSSHSACSVKSPTSSMIAPSSHSSPSDQPRVQKSESTYSDVTRTPSNSSTTEKKPVGKLAIQMELNKMLNIQPPSKSTPRKAPAPVPPSCPSTSDNLSSTIAMENKLRVNKQRNRRPPTIISSTAEKQDAASDILFTSWDDDEMRNAYVPIKKKPLSVLGEDELNLSENPHSPYRSPSTPAELRKEVPPNSVSSLSGNELLAENNRSTDAPAKSQKSTMMIESKEMSQEYTSIAESPKKMDTEKFHLDEPPQPSHRFADETAFPQSPTIQPEQISLKTQLPEEALPPPKPNRMAVVHSLSATGADAPFYKIDGKEGPHSPKRKIELSDDPAIILQSPSKVESGAEMSDTEPESESGSHVKPNNLSHEPSPDVISHSKVSRKSPSTKPEKNEELSSSGIPARSRSIPAKPEPPMLSQLDKSRSINVPISSHQSANHVASKSPSTNIHAKKMNPSLPVDKSLSLGHKIDDEVPSTAERNRSRLTPHNEVEQTTEDHIPKNGDAGSVSNRASIFGAKLRPVSQVVTARSKPSHPQSEQPKSDRVSKVFELTRLFDVPQ